MKSPRVTDCWGAWAEMEGWLQVCHQVGSYAVACWTQEHDEVGASCPWSASAAERSCRLDRALAVPRGALAVLAVPGLQETNERRKEEEEEKEEKEEKEEEEKEEEEKKKKRG